MKLGGVLAAVLTLLVYLASSGPPAPSMPGHDSARPRPSLHAVVLGVKLAHPPTKPATKAVVRTTTPKPTSTPTRKPAVRIATRTTPGATCVVGTPCRLTITRWTRTVGCTRVWLQAQRQTNPDAQCPPGWPYLG